MTLQVRESTPAEERELRQRARSRTEPARTVARAQLIWWMAQGHHVPSVAYRLRSTQAPVRTWVKRFKQQGRAGLADHPRTGRPPTATSAEIGAVLATSLPPPRTLGLPFACWTLDRLTTYLQERPAEAGGPLPSSRSHIDRIVSDAGLRWRKQATWFGERVDPACAGKRGPARPSARRPRRGVS